MKQRSPFKGWLTKLGVTPDVPRPVAPPAEKAVVHARINGEARADQALDEMRAQLATCLARLEHIDIQLRESRQRATSEEEQLRREAEELRTHLQQAHDSVAARDHQIEQLTGHIHGQQEQLAAADANSHRLQAALAAEQQARQTQDSKKAAAYREVSRALP